MIEQFDLGEMANRMIASLSKGYRQRVGLADALVHEPDLLILDEPTAGVDIEIRRSMWDFLRHTNELGTTIILTTHYLEEAENLCRHVAIIDEGNIIEDARMNTVLRKLQREVFVLSLRDPLIGEPVLDGFETDLIEECELEVALDAKDDLNKLFDVLNRENIHVLSLRNKANRLEELFMGLVESKQVSGQ